MHIRHRRQQGFTLIELLIGMGIMLILLTALFTLLSNSLNMYQLNSRRSETQQTVRIAAETIARDFRRAAQITAQTNTRIDFVVYVSQNEMKKISYYVDTNGFLYQKIDNGNGVPITGGNNVVLLTTSPVFSLTENNHVLNIKLTAQYAGNQAIQESVVTAVTGMNLAK